MLRECPCEQPRLLASIHVVTMKPTLHGRFRPIGASAPATSRRRGCCGNEKNQRDGVCDRARAGFCRLQAEKESKLLGSWMVLSCPWKVAEHADSRACEAAKRIGLFRRADRGGATHPMAAGGHAALGGARVRNPGRVRPPQAPLEWHSGPVRRGYGCRAWP